MNTKPTPQEITEKLDKSYRKAEPITMPSGHKYAGDIFYSDIYAAVKAAKYHQMSTAYSTVANELRRRGFYVHS